MSITFSSYLNNSCFVVINYFWNSFFDVIVVGFEWNALNESYFFGGEIRVFIVVGDDEIY